jgi:hypothetical protein
LWVIKAEWLIAFSGLVIINPVPDEGG